MTAVEQRLARLEAAVFPSREARAAALLDALRAFAEAEPLPRGHLQANYPSLQLGDGDQQGSTDGNLRSVPESLDERDGDGHVVEQGAVLGAHEVEAVSDVVIHGGEPTAGTALADDLHDFLDRELYRSGWSSGLLWGWAIGTGTMLPLLVWVAVSK